MKGIYNNIEFFKGDQMKKIFFIFIIYIFIFPLCAYGYDTEELAEEFESFADEIKADSGDIEKIINDIFDYDPRLAVYYKGYSGSHSSDYSIIRPVYDNKNIPIEDVYSAKSSDDFVEIITRALLYCKDSICITGKNITAENSQVNEYIRGVSESCPIAFMGYKGSNVSVLDTQIGGYKCYIINLEYDFEREALINMKTELEKKAFEIISENIAKDMPPYMKVFIIHNYIVNNCRYAYDYESEGDPCNYTAYGALVKGRAVCDGYASAAKILFDLCGVESLKIVGTSKGTGHAWNMVKLDNEYYHIDTTWDDPVGSDGIDRLKYNYYNITDDEIAKDHIWERSDYPSASGNVYTYLKTVELIRNDGNQYNEGYTSFESVFSKYPSFEADKEDIEPETQTVSSQSVLSNYKDNISVASSDIISYVYMKICEDPRLYLKIAGVFVIFILILKFIKR